MKKVFHFDSQREHYRADACVVSCIDARFELATRKFLGKRGIQWIDLIKIAGGAKVFASPAQDGERAFILEQVQVSIRLHATNRVMLMVHSDCGAYGGLKAFGGNAEQEAAHHESELQKAMEFLKENLPAIAVEGYFLKFDGVWAVEGGEPNIPA